MIEVIHPPVFVCAWCPDKATRDAAALAAGRRVTHGLCPVCLQKELQALAQRQVQRDITPFSFQPLDAA